MYFCCIRLLYDVKGQGFEYDGMENNAVIAEICWFTNFLNSTWQNKTKGSGNKKGLVIYTVPIFLSLCHSFIFTAKTIICEVKLHNNFTFYVTISDQCKKECRITTKSPSVTTTVINLWVALLNIFLHSKFAFMVKELENTVCAYT
jgi:hypothetical protein